MRYEKWIGDTSIQLEGEPDEIIQVLKYLDGTEDKNNRAVIAVKIDEDEITRKVVNSINKKTKADNKGVCI